MALHYFHHYLFELLIFRTALFVQIHWSVIIIKYIYIILFQKSFNCRRLRFTQKNLSHHVILLIEVLHLVWRRVYPRINCMLCLVWVRYISMWRVWTMPSISHWWKFLYQTFSVQFQVCAALCSNRTINNILFRFHQCSYCMWKGVQSGWHNGSNHKIVFVKYDMPNYSVFFDVNCIIWSCHLNVRVQTSALYYGLSFVVQQ